MNRTLNRALLAGLLLVCGSVSAFAQDAPLLRDIQSIPVFGHGRAMPLDSLARGAMDGICNQRKGKLSLDLYADVPEVLLKNSRYDGAKELFPDKMKRKFEPIELMVSWLVEPEKWEDIPFIHCEYDELRELILDDPTSADSIALAAAGKAENTENEWKLSKIQTHKYVSPRQIAESKTFRDYLTKLSKQKPKSDAEETKAESRFKERLTTLIDAYNAFRSLTLRANDPIRFDYTYRKIAPRGDRSVLILQLERAINVIQPRDQDGPGESFDALLEKLLASDRQIPAPLQRVLAKNADDLRALLGALHSAYSSTLPPPPKDEETAAGEDTDEDSAEKGADDKADADKKQKSPAAEAQVEYQLEQFEQIVSRLRVNTMVFRIFLESSFEKAYGEGGGKVSDDMRRVLRDLVNRSEQLEKIAQEMYCALYDNDSSRHAEQAVRVVPWLNTSALDGLREVKFPQSQPWMSLQGLLHGSDDFLYRTGDASLKSTGNDQFSIRLFALDETQTKLLQKRVAAVRIAWKEFAGVYADRKDKNRAERLPVVAKNLADTLRFLGTDIEPIRLKAVETELTEKQRDDRILAATIYPSEQLMNLEVKYNMLDPFGWSWVLSLVTLMVFGVAAIFQNNARKWFFWAGVSLLAAGILWTAYAFLMRIRITGWAPVTNMFETVVYVPWVVTLLGIYFLMHPIVQEGFKFAWRATALPYSWEAKPLVGQQQNYSASTWLILESVSAALRVALMGFIFYILCIAQIYDGGQTIFKILPDFSNTAWSETTLTSIANKLLVWAIGVVCFMGTTWFGPRVLLMGLYSVVTVPLCWIKQTNKPAQLSQVYSRVAFALAATAIAALGSWIAWYAPSSVVNERFTPLQPVLRSNFWLYVHVLTIVSSYGAGALALGLGIIALFYYLFGSYRAPVTHDHLKPGFLPADGKLHLERLSRRPPEQCGVLAQYSYKAIQVAVVLLAAGTILGGLWADVSWGRFWGWDPKEVWALISLLVYLGVLHGRYVGWFQNFGLIFGTVLGATMIIGSWYGVNFLLPQLAPKGQSVGLHSYGSGEAQGQLQVLLSVGGVWLLMLAAWIRYKVETSGSGNSHEQTAENGDEHRDSK